MMIHTPIDDEVGRSGIQLGGIPPGWVCGVLAEETGVGASSFCQAIVDMNEEAEVAWFNLSNNPGSADVLVDAVNLGIHSVIEIAGRLSSVVDFMIFDSILIWMEQSIPPFIREIQTICVENRVSAVIVGTTYEGKPYGGAGWKNHTDLLINLQSPGVGRITWWPEDEPTGASFTWKIKKSTD